MVSEICRADRTHGSNYGKPHVPARAERDGRECWSCLFCGAWLERGAE